MHPNLAALYRRKVETLHNALRDEASGPEALEIMRALIAQVNVTHSEEDGFTIELIGEIAAMVVEPMVQGAAGILVQPPGYLKKIRELLAAREPYYRQADVLVNTEMRSAREVATQVIHQFHMAQSAHR